MPRRTIHSSLTAMLCMGVLFGSTGSLLVQHKGHHPKSREKKAVKSGGVVKYKAHCGMIYSAAEAKKNHYICPMDHKPLKKIVVKH